jgi:N-acetylmuramoyl-L-alanine amidase
MNNTPGIVINDTALVSYYDVFRNSVIKATASYSSTTKTVTIKKNSVTITMKLGSKTATVNGVKKTMDVAPLAVKYRSQNTTKVLVPARFVAETLKLGYTWNSTTKSANITGPINLYYDGASHVYTGSKGKVTVNGTSIDLTTMPSIIINDTALIRAKKVLTSSGIGATYSYNSSTKVLNVTKGDKKIKFTMGSKYAYVNGTKYTMATAARVIKNKDTGSSYVFVPGSFTITHLGFNYSWNSTTKTSVITKKSTSTSSGGSTTIDADKTYLNYGVTSSMLTEYNYVNSIVNNEIINDSAVDKASLSPITRTMNGVNEVYTITSTIPFQNIQSLYESNNVISLNIDNSISSNITNTYENSIVNKIVTTYDSANYNTNMKLYLTPASAKYEVKLSDDKLSLTITIYNNYINNVTAKRQSSEDIVSITGINAPGATITNDASNVYVDLPYTLSAVGEKTTTISGVSITGLTITKPTTNSTRIAIKKTSTSSYYTSQSGNVLNISFTEPVVSNYDITIKLPSNVVFSTVRSNDFYLDYKFKIIIPGDYISYYKSNPIKTNDSAIKSTTVHLSDAGNTIITVYTTSIQGYKLTDKSNYIGVTIGKPRSIYKNIVVLDAGHGGKDPGATSKGTYEKNLNYDILYKYASSYFNASTSKIKVYYTRVDDTFVELADRAAFASKVGADLFISLHMNSGVSTAKGTEVYYSTANNTKTSSGLSSSLAAARFVSGLCNTLGSNNRGVKTANYTVIYKNTVPSILIELGFISNSTDYSNLTNVTYQKKAAKAIYDLTNQLFTLYPTGR